MISGLRQVAVGARDLERAEAFWRDVIGLEVIARFDPPGLVFLRLGDVRLLLERSDVSSLLYLAVDDVAAEVERLRAAGVTIESEAHVTFSDADGLFGPAGQDEVMAVFRDSEDNLVGLSGRR